MGHFKTLDAENMTEMHVTMTTEKRILTINLKEIVIYMLYMLTLKSRRKLRRSQEM